MASSIMQDDLRKEFENALENLEKSEIKNFECRCVLAVGKKVDLFAVVKALIKNQKETVEKLMLENKLYKVEGIELENLEEKNYPAIFVDPFLLIQI